ncbi:FixH family protein [Pelagovum pacificum]|uniref:FixH family protein n=1 Tax=Pelagovum pacificum TaxID=2588711 RepID=A0A5C5GDK5_9RHOB|nr:FixH family protein [Pelagovum pacificum]QQA44815.1 FixH family protein [Pelagovum pacificum]TNY32079.1 FixH family protein [Pelagovum pacificum]
MVIRGHHVLLGMTGAFGIIIAVNVTMATQAVRTFPGLETHNSYVASQEFDEARAAQEALGWEVTAHEHDGELVLSITDADGPVQPATLSGIFGRSTSVRDDQVPDFTFDGAVFRAPVEASGGNWNLRLEAEAEDGTPFQQRIIVIVD